MTYGEIIRRNCERITPQWWPKYAYHFTDVTNVVNILSLERLYSRVLANRMGVMGNDNASRQIIDMTATRAMAYARFYFRPLTPTQYYNEGYKHSQIRFSGDVYANIPVPIFLVFDLEQMLSTDGVVFSAQTQAGHGSPLYTGVENFAQLPFEKIYSDGPCDDDVRRYRHAEILCPDSYTVKDTLRMILCRNECEKATLLNMLRNGALHIYNRYKNFVRVAREHTFIRNGLFVESIVCHDDMISFEFAHTPQKRYYDKTYVREPLACLSVVFHFEWINANDATLYSTDTEVLLDYLSPDTIVFTELPKIVGASIMETTITIDNKIICVSRQPVTPYEMV